MNIKPLFGEISKILPIDDVFKHTINKSTHFILTITDNFIEMSQKKLSLLINEKISQYDNYMVVLE